MSTRSRIGILKENGNVESIYCHSDGYPEYNGRILISNYNDIESINKLLRLGDISILGEKIGKKHDFNNFVNGWVLAYHRDRGEEKVPPRIDLNKQVYVEKAEDTWAEYLYLFENNQWLVYDVLYKKQWVPVVELLNNEN